jgi:glycosyltransferase involved in cell wall biosynthesis
MKLSIIVPAYNVEKYITSTIQSLFNQTCGDFEVIIIDDGSTDQTTSIVNVILNQNKDQNNNFKIISKVNGGVSSARNLGLEYASGEYIMFLDGDDYVSNDLVKETYEVIDKEFPDMIYWGFDKVSENREIIEKFMFTNRIPKSLTGLELLDMVLRRKNTRLWTGSVLYKRSFIIKEKLKYTFGCTAGEDLEFIYLALSKADFVYFINKVLSFYVHREGSVTNKYSVKRFDSVVALQRVCQNFVNSGIFRGI